MNDYCEWFVRRNPSISSIVRGTAADRRRSPLSSSRNESSIRTPRSAYFVMAVDADVMRRVVRVPHAVLLAVGIGNEPEPEQSRLDHVHGLAMDVEKRR